MRPLRDALPLSAIDRAAKRKVNAGAPKHTGAYYEQVRLAVDNAGRLWLAYRHFYAPWMGFQYKSHVEQGWGVYARSFGEGGWSKLYRFSVDQGDGLQRLEIAPHEGGLCAAWTTGRTDRRPSKRPRGVVAAVVASAGGAAAKVELSEPHQASRPSNVSEGADKPSDLNSVEIGGKTYRLYYGDLHRHTDLSLCRVPIDGTIDDAYRYAIEVARLDFLGITIIPATSPRATLSASCGGGA